MRARNTPGQAAARRGRGRYRRCAAHLRCLCAKFLEKRQQLLDDVVDAHSEGAVAQPRDAEELLLHRRIVRLLLPQLALDVLQRLTHGATCVAWRGAKARARQSVRARARTPMAMRARSDTAQAPRAARAPAWRVTSREAKAAGWPRREASAEPWRRAPGRNLCPALPKLARSRCGRRALSQRTGVRGTADRTPRRHSIFSSHRSHLTRTHTVRTRSHAHIDRSGQRAGVQRFTRHSPTLVLPTPIRQQQRALRDAHLPSSVIRGTAVPAHCPLTAT